MIVARRIRPLRYMVATYIACLLWGSPLLVFSHTVSAGAVDNSGPFTITASTFTVTNLHIDQTSIQQGGSLADTITMDVVATDLVISKQVFLAGVGPTTFSTAATGSEPARLYGLRAHIVAIASAQGNFSNLSDILASKLQSPVSSGSNIPSGGSAAGTPGLPGNLSALSLTFTNVQIQATFLVVQAATLPNIVISVH